MARFARQLDRDALEQIVSCYMGPALAVARRILSDEALAEDAVQESFLRVIRKHRQYITGTPLRAKPGSCFSCWFYTIVRNVCIDMLRKQRRHKKAMDRISCIMHGASNYESSAASGKSLSERPKLLEGLSRGEREVLELRIIHNLGFCDIAAALGISEEAAKKRAQRALRRLRAKICDSQSPQGKLPVAL